MAVGSEGHPVLPGYVAMGRETTWGTYASATSAVEAISCGFHTDIESEKLDTIGFNRGFTKRVTLSKMVAGGLETFLHPTESVLLIAAALGGPIVSNSVTVGVYDHSVTAGNMDTTTAILGLSFNAKKGTHTFRYSGGRVNTMKISAAIGAPVKCAFEIIFKDSTQAADDISSILSVSSLLPMTFADGIFRYAATEALAPTTTAAEPIQAFELTVKNNLDNGETARELGSRVLSVLPPTRRDVELTITQRFDTTTAYQRFLQATVGAVELFFRSGDSLGNNCFPEITFRFPKVYQNSNDPVLGGAAQILSSQFKYDVIVDAPSTSTGKDIGITIRNAVASY